ncbi:hypothetical protein CPHO_08890 [Corynebacterium phocae]|uniref:M23ase beta-sheet core domain-containing protein n=1 Tax=Corynebacterium phocae TaxID=161895 RepID=A0A1L7D4E3_9CORY|nr:M23 family metallopeptidase [Corynebacterium phocae]APT92985.1 hypothetical protein CPHO_08890 [Corynebacterium phocae]KAA8723323.1 M23 family metallopeptidase [Corynebacterium phocae]
MKRYPDARRTRATASAVAVTAALTLSQAPNAMAHEGDVAPVSTTNGEEGSSKEDIDTAIVVLDTLAELAGAADQILNNESLPPAGGAPSGVRAILDPHVISGLAAALTPEVGSPLSPSLRGTTVEGYPVVFPTSGVLTSGFGMRWGAMHNGIDVANPVGTPIYAVMSGQVISSGPAQGFGHWIRIKHDNGAVSVYGHMRGDSLLVNVGDRVEAGQQIASIGNEGHSTGPHLHFEIHPDGATPADPQAWFAQQGIYF